MYKLKCIYDVCMVSLFISIDNYCVFCHAINNNTVSSGVLCNNNKPVTVSCIHVQKSSDVMIL